MLWQQHNIGKVIQVVLSIPLPTSSARFLCSSSGCMGWIPQLYLYIAWSWLTVLVHNEVPKTVMVVFLFDYLFMTLTLFWHSFNMNSSHLRESEAKNLDELVLLQQNPHSNKFQLETVFAHRTTNTAKNILSPLEAHRPGSLYLVFIFLRAVHIIL